MNTSQFMDKQILGLTSSSSSLSSSGGGGGGELLDLRMNPQPQEEQINGSGGVVKKGEEIMMQPSYDFHPIRTSPPPPPPPPPPPSTITANNTSFTSLDSKMASSNLKNAGILDPHVLTKVSHEEERSNYTAVTVADIDRTVKKYADNLLHALDGVSSRLSLLETRTHHLENSVDDLKLAIGNMSGSTDGKLRQFDIMLHQVQDCVQVLRNKHEVVEKLAKLQTSITDSQPSENPSTVEADSRQHQMPPPQPAIQLQTQAPPPSQLPMLPAPPAANAPPPPPPLQNAPSSHFPGHFPQPQIPSVPPLPRETYFPSSAQPTEPTHQQYQAPVQQQQAPPPPLPQQYQHAPQFTPYSQPPQLATANPSAQLSPPVPQQPEETVPYAPPTQTYLPSVRPPAQYMLPPTGSPPPFYGPNPGMYEPPASRPSSGPPPSYAPGYGTPGGSGYSDSYGYSGSPSHRGNSGMKSSSPFAPPSSASFGSSSNYGRLPTAQILPQAVPISSAPSTSTGNRVPIDDVVEKVVTMGFSREQARATVSKLTENGQKVDLNVVLDKLMNDGDQPQKGWYGR